MIVVVKTGLLLLAAETTNAAPMEKNAATTILDVVNRASEVLPKVCCRADKCKQGDKTTEGLKSAPSSAAMFYHLN